MQNGACKKEKKRREINRNEPCKNVYETLGMKMVDWVYKPLHYYFGY